MIGLGKRPRIGSSRNARDDGEPASDPRPTTGAPRTPADVAADLAAAQGTLAAREADFRDSAGGYEAALDMGRDAALAARQRLTEAEVDRDIARRAVDKLEAEHGLAVEGERRAEVAGIVAAADDAVARYRAAAERLLPEMGRSARELMRLWAEAEQANEAADDRLRADLKAEGVARPDRARPPVEGFRIIPGRPRQVLASKDLTLWTNAAGEAPGDAWQSKIKLQPDGTGLLIDRGSSTFEHRRHFREEHIVPAVSTRGIDRLVTTLCVPGVGAADRPGWTPLNNPSPQEVLARLAELEQPPAAQDPDPEPQVELRPRGQAFAVRTQPVSPNRPVTGPYGSAPGPLEAWTIADR